MGLLGVTQPGQPRYDGEEHNLQLTESVFGTSAPLIIGTCRVHGKLIFYGGFYAVSAPGGGKGLFGGKSQQFDYYADTLQLLGECGQTASCQGILNVWDQNGKLENQSTQVTYIVPSGGGSYTVPSGHPTVVDLGVYAPTNYNVTANDYGSGGSRTLTGSQNIKYTPVTSSPGANQYTFNATTGSYTFGPSSGGVSVTLVFSYQYSLYYFEAVQASQVPGSPYTVTVSNEAYFYQDNGVINVATGLPVVNGASSNGYTQNDGNYTFTSDLQGAYVYINYTYTSSDPDLTNSSSLNLTFFSGAQGQSPWSYMTSKYPGSAFGQTAMCYVGANPMALGESAAMPSYNYEVIGMSVWGGSILDAHPCDAMRLVLTDPLFGVNFPSAYIDPWASCYAYWASNGYFISKAINEQQSVLESFKQMIETGNVGAVWSQGLLKLIPYGDATTVGNGYTYTPNTTPQYTLTWDDILPITDHKTGEKTGDDPIQMSVRAPQDCYNYMQVQWTNRLNDYNIELTPEQNDAFINSYGFRPEAPQTWDWITTQSAATWALNLRLKRACYIRTTYRFALPFWFTLLEPMDMIVLPTGEAVRILSVELTSDHKNIIEAEQWTYGSNDVTIYPKQQQQSFQPTLTQALPGNAIPIFIQDTIQSASGIVNQVRIGATGGNPNWGGCNVYASLISPTGVDVYTQIGTIKEPSIIGILSSPLPASADPDITDTLSVDISLSQLSNPSAELITVSAQQLNSFVSLCAIVDQSGKTNEMIAYENAALTAQGRYNLTTLRRGALNTPIGAHTVGAYFAFLGPGYSFLQYQYTPIYVGQALHIKLQSFNLLDGQVQDLSQCIDWELFIMGQGNSALAVYSPSTYTILGSGGGFNTAAMTAAYDGNTQRAFPGTDTQGPGATLYCPFATGTGDVKWSGFPADTLQNVSTLYVRFLVSITSASGEYIILYSLDGGVTQNTLSFSGGMLNYSQTLTANVPAGTLLSNIQLQTSISGGPGSEMIIAQIWIQ